MISDLDFDKSFLEEILGEIPIDIEIKPKRFTAGENIILQGDELSEVLIVADGIATVYKLFPNGETFTILKVERGEFLGEIEAFTGAVANNMAAAETDCLLYCINKSDFLRLVYQSPKLAIKLLTFSNERLNNFNSYIMNFSYLSKAELFWVVIQSADELNEVLTKSYIADRINASQRTVNRLLVSAVSRGVIKEENGVIAILNREKLGEITKKIMI